ncbi:hypothetical protein PUNSTDRAFT_124605 [Punctularia strigosozonata HHB-11173 SS5]|uniref:uncharacterized protein n=1 Tax=Punctularia strigosozonata (strain HHB-11173) TaxID=741275 RepID=UPI000441674B|nr:uncharacterized protein PUNSTDRAFT_124605 [Punctularia strigosozonata HHB-11173 SS5]EIN13039.1 hypothetical protein PUNSTDRAFT_124605 [Punctularia strigosozonata HHB-11173 SS5]
MRFTSTGSTILIASIAISSAAAMPLSPVLSTQDVVASPALPTVPPTPSLASSVNLSAKHSEKSRKKRYSGLALRSPSSNSVGGVQMGLPAFIEGKELEPEGVIPINSWDRYTSEHPRTSTVSQSTVASSATSSTTDFLLPTSNSVPAVTTTLPTSAVESPNTSIPQATPSASASDSTDDREGDDDEPAPKSDDDKDDKDDDDKQPDLGGLIDDLDVLLPLIHPKGSPLEPSSITAIPSAQITTPVAVTPEGSGTPSASSALRPEAALDNTLRAMLADIPDLALPSDLPTSHPIKSVVAITSELYGVPTDTSEANPEYTANELLADMPHLTYTVLPTQSPSVIDN